MDKDNLESVFLKNFANYSEAMMAKEILEKNEIKSVMQKGNLNAPSEFTGWIGDVNIFVLKNKLNKAKEIINLYFKEK